MRSRTYAPLVVALALVVWVAVRSASRHAAPAIEGPQPSDPATPGPRELESPDEPLSDAADREPAGERDAPARVAIDAAPTVARAVADPIVLRGTVRAHKGGPLDGATVTFEDEAGNRRALAATYGAFEWRALGPGPLALRCQAPGFVADERLVVLDAARPEQREDFVLAQETEIPVRIAGPSGAVVPRDPDLRGPGLASALRVVATSAAPADAADLREGASSYRHATVSALGDAPEASGGISGVLVLQRPPPLYVSLVHGHEVLETRALPAVVPELAFTVDPERLRPRLCGFELRLVDGATGGPIAAKTAMLLGREAILNLQADDDGRIRAQGLLAGPYLLTASASGRGTASLVLDLRPGERRDLGELALRPAVAVRGVLLDADARPVRGWARVLGEGLPAAIDERFARASASAFGERFELELPGERARVEFGAGQDLDPPGGLVVRRDRGSSLGALRTYDAASGPFLDEVVVLEAATRVRFVPAADLASGAAYEVAIEEGGPVLRRGVLGLLPQSVYLVPGSYHLVARDRAGRVLREGALAVGREPLEVAIGR